MIYTELVQILTPLRPSWHGRVTLSIWLRLVRQIIEHVNFSGFIWCTGYICQYIEMNKIYKNIQPCQTCGRSRSLNMV